LTVFEETSRAIAADDLSAAIATAAAAVKSRPTDAALRMLLAELSVLDGDLNRAEAQARLAATHAPDLIAGLSVFRQHLRGLDARRAWWMDGAVPGFPTGPSELDRLALEVNVAFGNGDGAAARAALDRLEDARGTVPVIWDGAHEEDWRDLDDRLPHALEVVTAGGNYLWIGLDRVASIRAAPPVRPLDLALRPVRLALRDGSEADLLLCAVAPGPATGAEALGRVTEFDALPGGLTATRGQKAMLVGEGMRGALEFALVERPGG
jgi:type VI secretion system protein ImpE